MHLICATSPRSYNFELPRELPASSPQSTGESGQQSGDRCVRSKVGVARKGASPSHLGAEIISQNGCGHDTHIENV